MRRLVVGAAVLFGLLRAAHADDRPLPLSAEKEIVLEGGPSWDLMAVDSAARRLFVAHSPNIDVIDLVQGERIGTVPGFDRAHGVVALPAFGRGFASSGKTNRLVVFDLRTLAVTKQIETGGNPDAVLYVESTKEVWSFNGATRDVTCVDAASLEVKSTIALDGKPELAVEDPGTGTVFVNLEDQSAVAVIDAKAHKAVATRPVAPGEGPTGLAIDAKNRLLFVGCGNKKLVVLSAADGKAVATQDIGEHCDGVAFDPATGNLFASGRDGTTVVHEKDPKTFEPLGTIPTPGGKTCALDPATHTLYVSSGPKRGETGTVKVFVFGPK